MNDLTRALANSITQETREITVDLLEVGLDTVLDEGILKDIPILSTAIHVYQIGNSMKERHYIKKLIAFISEINRGIEDDEKRDYYKRMITGNASRRKKEIEYILLLLDRYIQAEKADMLAKLYLAYLDIKISWNDLSKYSEVIDRFLPGDYAVLRSASTYKTEFDRDTDSIQRLIALGLVIEGFRTMAIQEENGTLSIDPPELREKSERNYTRTKFGSILVDILDGI